MLTLTFGGATRVMPNYNVMGIAKAALEAGFAISPPISAVTASASTRFRRPGAHACRSGHGRRARDVQLQKGARAAANDCHDRGCRRRRAYLLSDLSNCVTGEIHFVDAGYNVIAMPRPERRKTRPQGRDGEFLSRCGSIRKITRHFRRRCASDLRQGAGHRDRRSARGSALGAISRDQSARHDPLPDPRGRHAGAGILSDHGISRREIPQPPLFPEVRRRVRKADASTNRRIHITPKGSSSGLPMRRTRRGRHGRLTKIVRGLSACKTY